ncbi:uncharacterized protein LACBIDRAFT_310796 [Laccaria bicolor S238N-H82]|uniref:Predicted protein n=1 Tax=Laccaria bicolor (strain S238N-H82 / ATCC MYA-4686) TaxID=486041 RepID=B0DV35_LACBS|nr:uncharacterized protein LACBIDRAFT_310796 [Laccaria bicolor S238N-H82]EDR01444.1 predicted protein [Laccaria bicolor S238N-H82]|eukprot:XP_001887796.1 predicted protein [Laccaria bicolor S238N-H82]
MQLPLFLFNILLVLPLVHGQGISSLPPCGMQCVNTTATSLGCSVNDAKCLCSKANFVSSSLNCAQGTCPPEDLSSTVGILGELCAAASPPGSTSITKSSSTPPSPLTTSSNSNTPSSGPTLTSTAPQTSISTSITGSPAPSTVTVTASNTQAGTTLSVPANFLPTSVSESGSSTTVVVATIYRPPPSSGAMKGELCWGFIMGTVGVVMGAWSL